MDLDPSYLIFSLLISSVGFVLYRFGRSQRRFPQTVFGITLMIYPYFVSDWRVMVGIAIVLGGALWSVVRFTDL